MVSVRNRSSAAAVYRLDADQVTYAKPELKKINPSAKQLLTEDEGRKAQPYYDTKGYVTAGIGRLLDPRKPCKLPDEIVDRLFDIDFEEKRAQAAQLPGFDRLNQVQQAAVISMVYQMGYAGVLGFPGMLKALAAGDVARAAREGLDSKWAREDSPRRAQRQKECRRYTTDPRVSQSFLELITETDPSKSTASFQS